MNILLTCGGGRNYLVDAWRSAVAGCGEMFACDVSADAPALHHADKGFVVPEVTDPGYVDALLTLCDRHRVRLLVPTLEPELPLLAAHRDAFAAVGTVLLISTPEVVDTCYDKIKAGDFLSSCGVRVPRTWASIDDARRALARGDLTFPVVVKPRWGVGSLGVSFPEDEDELTLSWTVTSRAIVRSAVRGISATDPLRCILVQEHLSGEEFGFDVINDLRGRHVSTLVRRKIRMRAGQTDRAESVAHDEIRRIGQLIGEGLAHVGVLDCDAIVTASGCFVLDLNPRIGGGYPFSHLAGANIPAALVAWARGEEPEPQWLRADVQVSASRYDSFALLHDGTLPDAADRQPALSTLRLL
jgi:carbamoyl-phosphate synthase large subunit